MTIEDNSEPLARPVRARVGQNALPEECELREQPVRVRLLAEPKAGRGDRYFRQRWWFRRFGWGWKSPPKFTGGWLRAVVLKGEDGQAVVVPFEKHNWGVATLKKAAEALSTTAARKVACATMGWLWPEDARNERLAERDQLLCDYARGVEVTSKELTYEFSSTMRKGERIDYVDGKLVSVVTREWDWVMLSPIAEEMHRRFKEYKKQRWWDERLLAEPRDPADKTWHACLQIKADIPNPERLTQILRRVIEPERPVAKPREQLWGNPEHARVHTEVYSKNSCASRLRENGGARPWKTPCASFRGTESRVGRLYSAASVESCERYMRDCGPVNRGSTPRRVHWHCGGPRCSGQRWRQDRYSGRGVTNPRPCHTVIAAPLGAERGVLNSYRILSARVSSFPLPRVMSACIVRSEPGCSSE